MYLLLISVPYQSKTALELTEITELSVRLRKVVISQLRQNLNSQTMFSQKPIFHAQILRCHKKLMVWPQGHLHNLI